MTGQLTRRIGPGGSKLFLSQEDILALPAGGIETGVAAITNNNTVATVGTAVIPGGLVQNVGGVLRLRHSGFLLNNTGTTQSFTFTLRCNETNIFLGNTSTFSASAQPRHCTFDIEFIRMTATTGRGFGLFIGGSAATPPTTGVAGLSNAGIVANFCPADDFAINWEQANTIDLRLTLSNASNDLTYTPRFTHWCNN